MIIAVDFDGTLHDYKNPVKGRRMGPPMPGAVEGIEALQDAGHEIIIHTVRGGSPQHILDWCDYYGIEVSGVTEIKPNADIYLDDKGMQFTTWPAAVAILAPEEED